MIRLNGGDVDDTQPGTVARANELVFIAESAKAWSRGSWENTVLFLYIDSLTVSNRLAGSSVSVARLHRMAPTRFPPASASSSGPRLTGTIACNGVSGSAF